MPDVVDRSQRACPSSATAVMTLRKYSLKSYLGVLTLLGLSTAVLALHKAPEVAEDADWATRHMAEEHHIGNFDASSFFTIHDFDGNSHWDEVEIQTTYGLYHKSNKDTPQSKRDEVVHESMRLIDKDGDGLISRAEWINFSNGGGVLPDFGVGPGHHGDDEYEYEIHHWEQYHDENTTEEDLIHPEDIEHFAHHDHEDDERAREEELIKLAIVVQNIPQLFRRN